MHNSFFDLEYAAKKKLMRRDRFLAEIDSVTLWDILLPCATQHLLRYGWEASIAFPIFWSDSQSIFFDRERLLINEAASINGLSKIALAKNWTQLLNKSRCGR